MALLLLKVCRAPLSFTLDCQFPSRCYAVLIIPVPEDSLLTFLKKTSQVGTPEKQISSRNTRPERELVFGKNYCDYSSAIFCYQWKKRVLFGYVRERSYSQKENNKANVKTYLLLLVCDFLLASCGHVDQLCGV